MREGLVRIIHITLDRDAIHLDPAPIAIIIIISRGDTVAEREIPSKGNVEGLARNRVDNLLVRLPIIGKVRWVPEPSSAPDGTSAHGTAIVPASGTNPCASPGNGSANVGSNPWPS